MFKLILVFISLLTLSKQHFIEYEYRELPRPHPPLPQPGTQSQESTPSQIMVDLTNDLAYRVMHYHSILNRNNFAYSPSALMSVLVALYEGSAGRSSLELRNALLLPTNRDILRIGYRDIHRRLRTYFFDQENPLAGLSLNKENVTITTEYESLLHFYGYDLGMDMISSTMTPPLASSTTPSNEIPPETTTLATTENITTTTQLPLTTTTMEIQSTTIEATTETPTESTMTTSTINTTEAPETTTTETNEMTTNTTPTSNGITEETTQFEAEETTTEPAADSDTFQRLVVQPNTLSTNAKIISLPPGQEYLPPAPKKSMSRSSRPLLSRMQSREKRHLFGLKGLKGLDTSIYFSLFNHQQPPLPFGPPVETIHSHGHEEFLNDDLEAAVIAQQVDFTPHFDFFNHNPAPAAIHFDVDHNFGTSKGANQQVINHVFYLNTREIIQSTYKVYNSVLYYKYIEELKMTVLELELDSVEYNLMIMLPDFNVDLLAVTASLKFGPTLGALRRQLKPRWVQAIIPDFKLHGKMFLTSDLQNMGINDIFEPTRADFRPMTEESGIYVKHIEQSIDVNIRTRPINQIKRNVGPQPRPIQVSVNHPFLFFIIDRDFDIATMAGRVLNPLNVRIQ